MAVRGYIAGITLTYYGDKVFATGTKTITIDMKEFVESEVDEILEGMTESETSWFAEDYQ